MKQFRFPLERIREWREKQLEVEEARLERLSSEKALVERSRELLEQEARESAAGVTRATAMEAFELQAIDGFRRYAAAQRTMMAKTIAEVNARIAEQRRNLMEARRKLELLNKLKARKWQHWNAELARESETQAAELYLAKWKKLQ